MADAAKCPVAPPSANTDIHPGEEFRCIKLRVCHAVATVVSTCRGGVVCPVTRCRHHPMRDHSHPCTHHPRALSLIVRAHSRERALALANALPRVRERSPDAGAMALALLLPSPSTISWIQRARKTAASLHPLNSLTVRVARLRTPPHSTSLHYPSPPPHRVMERRPS
jgi:hypothetical protein